MRNQTTRSRIFRKGKRGERPNRRANHRRIPVRPSDEPSESPLYRRFANIYDVMFERSFAKGIKAAIRHLDMQPGERVLEIGVGTGISLAYYTPHVNVMAIDLSPHMLQQAKQKAKKLNRSNVSFACMDAMQLQFNENEFDYVCAFHVATVVPDPQKLAAEMCRVCKPNGKIVVVNHFRSQHKLIGPVVGMLDPVTRHLGWRTNLTMERWTSSAPLHVERVYKLSPRSLFTTVVATKAADSQAL